jgi:hypothetical protein
MWLVLLKWISISLPKRLLLWLRSVLALPNASKMGLVCSTADKQGPNTHDHDTGLPNKAAQQLAQLLAVVQCLPLLRLLWLQALCILAHSMHIAARQNCCCHAAATGP